MKLQIKIGKQTKTERNRRDNEQLLREPQQGFTILHYLELWARESSRYFDGHRTLDLVLNPRDLPLPEAVRAAGGAPPAPQPPVPAVVFQPMNGVPLVPLVSILVIVSSHLAKARTAVQPLTELTSYWLDMFSCAG